MSDNIKLEVREDEVFDKNAKAKGKPKRTLTDKQKEALAVGRQKAKEKRLAKLDQEAEKRVEAKIRKEQKDLLRADKQKADHKKERKKKLSEQEIAREKVKRFEREKKLGKYNALKMKALENCNTVKEFDTMDKILGLISEEDIMDDTRGKAKMNKILSSVRNYSNKNK